MVVLLSALCDLGTPELASEALDACYFDVSAIPYEVLWAALQAHAVAGRSAEARHLLLSWLQAHTVEPEQALKLEQPPDVAAAESARPALSPDNFQPFGDRDQAVMDGPAHDARVLRLVRLMLTRVKDPEDRQATKDLARHVARSLTLQSSRDQLWAEIRCEGEAVDDAAAADSAQASIGCVSATCGSNGNAHLSPRRRPGTSSIATSAGADGTCCRAISSPGEMEIASPHSLRVPDRADLLQAILSWLRSWQARFVPLDWCRLREAAEEATNAAMRLSHRRVNGTALAVAVLVATAALLASLRKRVRGPPTARRLHGFVQQLGALLGMLLGADALVNRAPS
jgi:hypothetical protein